MAQNTTVRKHLCEGRVIPVQPDAMDMKFNSTQQLKDNTVTLIANRHDNHTAIGWIFLDDGISIKNLTDKEYEIYIFVFKTDNTIEIENKNKPKDATQSVGPNL